MAIFLAMLHIKLTKILFTPGLILYIIDKIIIFIHLQKKVNVIDAKILKDSEYKFKYLFSNRILKLVLQSSFKYKEGQYFYLYIPSISHLSHPFSVATTSKDSRNKMLMYYY